MPRRLCTRTTGCLIVIGSARLAQHMVRLQGRGCDMPTCFAPRPQNGRPAITAIFPALPPGRYEVACAYANLSAQVMIAPGRVVRVTWD